MSSSNAGNQSKFYLASFGYIYYRVGQGRVITGSNRITGSDGGWWVVDIAMISITVCHVMRWRRRFDVSGIVNSIYLGVSVYRTWSIDLTTQPPVPPVPPVPPHPS